MKIVSFFFSIFCLFIQAWMIRCTWVLKMDMSIIQLKQFRPQKMVSIYWMIQKKIVPFPLNLLIIITIINFHWIRIDIDPNIDSIFIAVLQLIFQIKLSSPSVCSDLLFRCLESNFSFSDSYTYTHTDPHREKLLLFYFIFFLSKSKKRISTWLASTRNFINNVHGFIEAYMSLFCLHENVFAHWV